MTARAHTKETFAFTADAPMKKVAPLFGADKERAWVPEWNPQFIRPQPPRDEQGMVFTVAQGRRKAYWVNTEFDAKNGRVQYSYMIPDILVTLITIKLTPDGEQARVEVEYERTSLSAEGDAHVLQFAAQDRKAGVEWEEQVNGYLERARSEEP